MAMPSERPTNTIARPKSSGFSLIAASAAEPVYATAIPAPTDDPATAMAAPMKAPLVSADDDAVSWIALTAPGPAMWLTTSATRTSTTRQVAPSTHAATRGFVRSRTLALTPHPAAMTRPARERAIVAVMVQASTMSRRQG